MTIGEMIPLLDAKILRGDDAAKLGQTVVSACSSDLMSDVLAFVNDKTVLITGLVNPHVVRTAEMLDLKCLIFSRGKVPPDDILDQADELGLVVLATRMTSFTACGVLYEGGVRGSSLTWKDGQ